MTWPDWERNRCSRYTFFEIASTPKLTPVAKLRLCVDAGLQLYGDGDVGGPTRVRLIKHSNHDLQLTSPQGFLRQDSKSRWTSSLDSKGGKLIPYPSGGPAGLVYGFIVAFFGTLATFTTMGELASMYVFFSLTCVPCFRLINRIKGRQPLAVNIIGSQCLLLHPRKKHSVTPQVCTS